MGQEALFQFSFLCVFAHHQEIECVRVLGDLLRQVRLQRWRVWSKCVIAPPERFCRSLST
jgi:hypothetical protein